MTGWVELPAQSALTEQRQRGQSVEERSTNEPRCSGESSLWLRHNP